MEPPTDLELPHERRRRRRNCRCSADFCRCVVGECLCTFFFVLIAGTLDIDWSNSGTTPCPPLSDQETASDSIVEYADAAKVVQIALTLGLGGEYIEKDRTVIFFTLKNKIVNHALPVSVCLSVFRSQLPLLLT